MNILFLHQNFPGQFLHVARALQAGGKVAVRALTDAGNRRPEIIATERYAFSPQSIGRPFPLAFFYAQAAARGAAAAEAMLRMKAAGYAPDLVIGHPGWGETLFVKDVWPTATLVSYAEFYYGMNSDADFDPEFRAPDLERLSIRLRARNAPQLQALQDADFGIAPTRWQAGRFPASLCEKIAVLHEGIDTGIVAPSAAASFQVPDGPLLRAGDEVVTFVNRNLEPYRGFHVFMRALPQILAQRPAARVVLVGGDEVSYGSAPKKGGSWRQTMLEEVGARLPLERVHFVGKVPYPQFLALMQLSAAHVYLTYPFVLSWSMLEAMSAGALVIGSRTAPVEEVIAHGENGLLFDFFDVDALAAQTIEALASPERFTAIRAAARRTIVERYDLKTKCLPQWLGFLSHVARERAAALARTE